MANKPFVKHKITGKITGSTRDYTFWFVAPKDIYDGLAASITGVEELRGTTEAPLTPEDQGGPVCTVEALLKSGFAVRKVIAYTTGSGASLRRRYAKIIVTKEKADTFAPTGSFRGGDIRGVVNPLDASFS